MRLLISFCNQRPDRPPLGLLDVADRSFVPLGPEGFPPCHGATGLAPDGERVHVAIQQAVGGRVAIRSTLGVLSRELQLGDVKRVRRSVDVHSVLVDGDGLLVVSSGTDELVRVEERAAGRVSETVVYRAGAALRRADRHHLNSICRWQGRVLVSGFGRMAGETWTSARNGFVVDAETGETLAEGIYHPHSLLPLGDDALLCASKDARVVTLEGETIAQLDGYTRGLCAIGERLFVGTSKSRHVDDQGTCAVTCVSLATREPEWTVDLGEHADEIYDLLPLSPGGRRPDTGMSGGS